jgi:hypothetical protein
MGNSLNTLMCLNLHMNYNINVLAVLGRCHLEVLQNYAPTNLSHVDQGMSDPVDMHADTRTSIGKQIYSSIVIHNHLPLPSIKETLFMIRPFGKLER